MLLSPSALVLVAVINHPRDLEIARLLGWYRIPLARAPKVVAVDFLAFYQTAAFGDDKWRIQTIAPVLGHELTTRAELLRDEADHPRAQAMYYKLQLGPLQSLPRPILAKSWRRITFLYTTGEYLLSAETVNDLVIAEEERKSLWQALRERASLAQRYGNPDAQEIPPLEVDATLLAALLGLSSLDQNRKLDGKK